MLSAAIVTGSLRSFLAIKEMKDLADATLILWKPDFATVTGSSSEIPDSLGDGVDPKVLSQVTLDIHNTVSGWYFDESGSDLSLTDGCSLGTVFESSTELLFYNISQCFLEFNRLLGSYDSIFIDTSEDPVKGFVASWLETHNYGNIEVINLNDAEHSAHKRINPMTLLRDLEYNLKGTWIDTVIGSMLKLLQPINKKNIFILDSGKFEEYLSRKKSEQCKSFSVLTPIRRNWKTAIGNSIFWQRTGLKSSHNKVTSSLENSDAKGWTQTTEIIPLGLFQDAIKHFVLVHWPRAFSYFNYYVKLFRSFKTSLAVFCSEGTEMSLVSAFAAKKVGIPTIVMPHGIAPWSHSSLIKRSDRVFESYCSIGGYDTQKYLDCGLTHERILDINLPWFSSEKLTLKPRANEKGGRRKAMLLPLDTGFSLTLSAGSVVRHVRDMIEVCELCEIEVYGIKFRSEREAQAFGLVIGENEVFGRKTMVYAGYGSLSDYFKDIDLIIGPFNSGTAECALANVDYYCFHDISIYSENPNVCYDSLKTICHNASTRNELQKNIIERRIFKDTHNAQSLVTTSDLFLEACSNLDNAFEKYIS